MWKISQIICMGFLVGLSVSDIRFRRIPTEFLILGNIAAVAYQCVLQKTDLWLLLLGAAVGGAFLLLSKVTREGIGYGDSWAILILGLYLGLWGQLSVLAAAFVLLVPAGMVCLAAGKTRRRKTLPFFPFLAGGYFLTVLAGWGKMM